MSSSQMRFRTFDEEPDHSKSLLEIRLRRELDKMGFPPMQFASHNENKNQAYGAGESRYDRVLNSINSAKY